MKLLAWICLAACGGSPKPLEPEQPLLKAVIGDALVKAIGTHDVATIASVLEAPLAFGGLWFTDAECARQFPTQTKIAADRISAFAACLATLPLQISPRGHTMPDIVVLEYEPGFEVELQYATQGEHAWVTWIGYAGRRDPKDALPTITGAALDHLRIGPAPLQLDATTQAALTADAREFELPFEYAWLKVCIDATGAVTGVHSREITSGAAEEAFSAAARTWSFHPFEVGRQPIRCAR